MSLLSKVLDKTKKPELGEGIHDNCIILAVSNEERKKNDGTKLARNCYTKFGQIVDGKVVKEFEVSWFNLDILEDKRFNAFFSSLDQMYNIISEVYEDKETNPFHAAVDKAFEEAEITDMEFLKTFLENAKASKPMLKAIQDAYVVILQEKLQDKVMLRLKLAYDNKGLNIGLPRYGNVVENMKVETTELSFTKIEQENKIKSLTPATPTGKSNISAI